MATVYLAYIRSLFYAPTVDGSKLKLPPLRVGFEGDSIPKGLTFKM